MICTAALSVSGVSLYYAAPGAHYVARSFGIHQRKIRPLIACTKAAAVVLGATALKTAGLFNDTIFFTCAHTGVLALAALFLAFEPEAEQPIET